jgi:uncharacterized protein
MALDWEQGALADGLACYRRHEFFEAHEHWESVWMNAAEPEKTFLQAMIHVTVAMHHKKRGNVVGARRQLARALGKLANYQADFCGIGVEQLRSGIADWLENLNSGDSVESLDIPPIR